MIPLQCYGSPGHQPPWFRWPWRSLGPSLGPDIVAKNFLPEFGNLSSFWAPAPIRNEGPGVWMQKLSGGVNLRNWKWFDPKGEWMWCTKEDRVWRWGSSLGEWWQDAPGGKVVIATQATFWCQSLGLRFCFRFICIDPQWCSKEACDSGHTTILWSVSSFVNILCFFKEPFITLPCYIDCFLLKHPVMQLEKCNGQFKQSLLNSH